MQILPSQIFIYPFTLTLRGQRINTFEYGLDDSDVDGWNVQAFGLINGTAGILDDGDFADINAAYAFAQELAVQYQIPIDCMDDRSAIVADHHLPTRDALDHDDLRMLENCG